MGLYETEAAAQKVAKQYGANYYQDKKSKQWYVAMDESGEKAYSTGGIMPNEHLFVSLILVFICISFLINYIYLWKDNKYLFYMKKFKSKKIDAKTKCISLLIVVVPFFILIASIFCIS